MAYFRVFKKTSPNGKVSSCLALHMPSADHDLSRQARFHRSRRVRGHDRYIARPRVDELRICGIADGMVLIDEDYLKENKRVSAHLLAAFRYGREDLDVLGLTFRKDLITQQFQVRDTVNLNIRETDWSITQREYEKWNLSGNEERC